MIVDQQDFNPLIGEVWHTSLLPPKQVKEIYRLIPNRERMVVGIQWCQKSKVVKLLMGNFATITIPEHIFPEGLPLHSPKVEDYGFRICFGNYEVDLYDILFI